MPTAIITGSARRIGKKLAVNFAKKGWDVVIHYNTSFSEAEAVAAEVRSYGRNTASIHADLRYFEQVENLFKHAIDSVGIPDLLINNAAIFPPRRELSQLTAEDWNNTIASNLSSQFYCAKIFSETARENSRIINIASLGGVEVWRNRVAYNISKAGVVQLTKALALELAPRISVNCICPGNIAIPDEPNGVEDIYEIPTDRIPMGKYGTPDDIFDAAYFFATASNYVTGQILIVDGGYNLARRSNKTHRVNNV